MDLTETDFAYMSHKQVSQLADIILDQTGAQERKYSRPKTSTDKFISAKQGFCTEKRNLLAFEMGAK